MEFKMSWLWQICGVNSKRIFTKISYLIRQEIETKLNSNKIPTAPENLPPQLPQRSLKSNQFSGQWAIFGTANFPFSTDKIFLFRLPVT